MHKNFLSLGMCRNSRSERGEEPPTQDKASAPDSDLVFNIFLRGKRNEVSKKFEIPFSGSQSIFEISAALRIILRRRFRKLVAGIDAAILGQATLWTPAAVTNFLLDGGT
jgi:hypothetical protein